MLAVIKASLEQVAPMSKSFVSESPLPRLPLWDKLKAKRAPISFELEVTARCNNNCRHCYINVPAGDQEARARELSLDEILGISREAAELGAVWCLLTGGEPLLREDFFDIYLGLKRLGLLVSVFTNACLVTGDHTALFRQYPPRAIEVTVYGVTQETYERVTRRPGSFASFRRGLRLLQAGGVEIRLKTMALRANVSELPQIAAFCREHAPDHFRFDPLLHLRYDGDPRRNEDILSQRLTPEEIATLEQTDSIRQQAIDKECHRLVAQLPDYRLYERLFYCSAGLRSFSLSYDGRFRLCSSLWHPDCVYDLRKGSLKDAWENFVPRVRELRGKNASLMRCSTCPFLPLCLWCPAHVYLETGNLDAWVEYFCLVTQARARMACGKFT
jgi:radical SAM protein with 4Fe4S-binding SPASM domain